MKINKNLPGKVMLTLMVSVLVGSLCAEDRPAGLSAGYRFIGHYKLNSKIRVEAGEAVPVVISPLTYRVFSDGIDVRVYCRSSGEDSFTNYEIYRSDGIGVARKTGEIDVVAGVQGYCTKGDMIRQVSVTRNSLTLVKMPPRSHRVVVTRAVAIKKASIESKHTPAKETQSR
ncbi:MAG: hypothetical protein KJO79_02025 [Verrucomicrobiae bacterium]|nr:hypothetical protein [Verrucomicrobiae bacterium]NNJ85930.1 hypothetical protein [Akkermansiaceae bacterium]